MLTSLLADRQPVSVEQAEWSGGLALEFALYLGPAELPAELVTSVRCLVTVGERLVACQDINTAVGILPGGRIEAGESWADTACREVHEETGWQVDAESLTMLGFLHFRHTSPVPVDHPFPHPDFLQVVMHGSASGGSPGWIDTEGYVLRSWLIDVDEADSLPVTTAERLAVRALVR